MSNIKQLGSMKVCRTFVQFHHFFLCKNGGSLLLAAQHNDCGQSYGNFRSGLAFVSITRRMIGFVVISTKLFVVSGLKSSQLQKL
jgi:hypothetical protein